MTMSSAQTTRASLVSPLAWRDVASARERLYDLVVIGGGVVGTGIARDAVLRGLSVALVEKEDFGYGTSSRPTRLIHGGLRYLEMYDFGLVREDLREREILLRLAPHLVRPLPFLVPFYDKTLLYRAKLRAGMLLYDVLSYDKSLPTHRMLNTPQTLAAEPLLSPDNLSGAALYYDAQAEYTERLCVENALSAAEHGATLLTHMQVESLQRDVHGAVSGVQAHDLLGHQSVTIRGRYTVNASGPWLDAVLGSLGPGRALVRRTKGVHLITPASTRHAVVLFTGTDGRLFFVVPWLGYTMLGTTDTDYHEDLDDIRATDDDITYLVDAVRRYLPHGPWDTRLYSYAGVRSLMNTEGVAASSVSRKPILFDHGRDGNMPGLLSIIGGKLTAHRGLAEEVVDHASRILGLSAHSSTARLPLPGGGLPKPDRFLAANGRRLAAESGLSETTIAYLVRVYGSRYTHVLALCLSDPGAAEMVCAHTPAIMAQVDIAVREEMAVTLSDVLLRRLMVSLHTCRGLDAAVRVGRRMAWLCGWDAERLAAEIAAYERDIDRIVPSAERQPAMPMMQEEVVR